MEITQAHADDVAGLARLLWLDTNKEELAPQSVDAFAAELARWWAVRPDTHLAFVARLSGPEIVGMAWVALLPRVPRPGATNRLSADVQTVFVLPERRGRGIGSALVEAVAVHAANLGASRVTVHSGRRAVPVYERLGFQSSRQLLQRPPDAATADDRCVIGADQGPVGRS
ncbi:GNAT family N-acetyltransferase [Catellatospora sp. KI3]|uniref:GNAT family N-acetyltransferase n=1 Tax=Catellatospora sp. KI3 TaxID=3041620 RepID=UPI0024823073|nr:GNAT family N-acetyltransferase [Catellatospora sp. KI3]MDI1462189.1 GNAT family N-acetyltransferase [Catellatospora sp. KI3]